MVGDLRLVASTGAKASDFDHRFSTKFFDTETRLYYYGFRYYSSELGRLLSRDPIGEMGGLNIYVFVANNPVQLVDKNGQGILQWTIRLFGWSKSSAGGPFQDAYLDFVGSSMMPIPGPIPGGCLIKLCFYKGETSHYEDEVGDTIRLTKIVDCDENCPDPDTFPQSILFELSLEAAAD